jgi:hypothetical protein
MDVEEVRECLEALQTRVTQEDWAHIGTLFQVEALPPDRIPGSWVELVLWLHVTLRTVKALPVASFSQELTSLPGGDSRRWRWPPGVRGLIEQIQDGLDDLLGRMHKETDDAVE